MTDDEIAKPCAATATDTLCGVRLSSFVIYSSTVYLRWVGTTSIRYRVTDELG
ncbi:MAG: hypothetical protein AAGD11_15450 [Planctomycetota bacterium]